MVQMDAVVVGVLIYREIGLDVVSFTRECVCLDLQSPYAFDYGSTLAIDLSILCRFSSNLVQYAR
jgi:hypothetical protein